MSLDSVLLAGRTAALRRMTAAALVKRPGGKIPGPDGFEVDGWTPVYAALPCWVDSNSQSSGTRTINVGDLEVQTATRVLKVPYDATDLRDGDIAQVVGGACDGRFFRVVEATFADQKKQQELPVVEVQAPEGW